MTQVDTKPGTPEKGSRRGSNPGLASTTALVLAVAAGLLLASCSNDEGEGATATVAAEAVSPQEALLHDYAAARNSGDIDALVGYFTSRPEQKRHPLEPWEGKKRRSIDPLGYLNGVSEIRTVEGQVPAVQGSGSGVEFFAIVVNENPVSVPDVEFRWRFLFGADGSESGGEAGCVGGDRGAAFIQNGKFAVLDWGFKDPTACES
jgi:hypothetical protein